MGLIKAALGSLNSTMADQWKEYFYCEALDKDVLVAKGEKRVTKKFSSNKHGNDNIISNGSIIAVADGQCMMIVDQGKVVEVCAEPGEFVYDSSTEPSIFSGDLGSSILDTFKNVGKRFTFGGEAPKDQRVYYFNTKEIVGNKYGTANPVPFRVVDRNIGLDIDISVRCNGEYSYKMIDPLLFYTNVCGNITNYYDREEIDSMLKTELMTALQPAFAKISELGIRYSALPGHTLELSDALNEVLSSKWKESRGIVVASFGINSITAPKEDEDMIKQLQKSAVMRDPTMAAASLVGAQAQAMQDAAKNQNGAMMGFAGMNMAQSAGGFNAANLFSMGQQQPTQAQVTQPQEIPKQKIAGKEWICNCGAKNTGKFCQECGEAKPAVSNDWSCVCGAVNTGKFCSNCGKARPEKKIVYRCDKCGWEPEDPMNPPKFCPECGNPFNESDQR